MTIDVSKLKGQHVYLQELRDENIPVLKKLANNKRIWEFTRTLLIDETYDSQFERYISVAKNPNGDGNFGSGIQKTFVIYCSSDDTIIGMTRYYGINKTHKRLDIGYTWYIPEVWGKVHNKECKLLLLQYAFETMQFNRVGFHVAHINIRSQKAVEKIGGQKEGILRKHSYQPDGSIRDTVLYSIIDEEWPSVKKVLQKLVEASPV